MRSYLINLSQRYDIPPGTTSFDLATYTFQGTSGHTQLDIDAAIPLIERALFDINPDNRVIDLPIRTIEGQRPSMDNLREAIITYLAADGRLFFDGPQSAVSVFVVNLETGEEMGIQENLRHDATSTIKIGILMNYFRNTLREPTASIKYDLANAVICSDNGSANELMEITGDEGWFVDGIRRTNDTMCHAGAVNTRH